MTKMKLNVDVSNPLFIVPRNTKNSEEYLQLDLGRIIISNNLHSSAGEVRLQLYLILMHYGLWILWLSLWRI